MLGQHAPSRLTASGGNGDLHRSEWMRTSELVQVSLHPARGRLAATTFNDLLWRHENNGIDGRK